MVDAPATVDVAQTMGRGLALRQAFEQAKQDAQDRQDQQAAQQTIAQSGGNLDTAIQTLYQRGLARPAMALEAVRAKRQKDAGDLLKTTLGNEAERYNVVSKAANGITDQATQDATIARLKATDPQTADVMAQTLGPTYNPDNVTKAQTISLNAKDSAEMKHQAAIAYQESQKTSQDGVKFLSSMLAGTPQEHWDTVYQHAPSFVGPDVIKTVQGMVQTPDQAKALALGPQKDTEDKVQSAEIEAIKAFTAANGRKPTEAELDGIHKRFKEAGTVVRVSTGGGGTQGGLTAGEGGGLELAGTMTRLLGRVPVGMARAGTAPAIMNEAARQNKLIGQTPVAMMQKAAVYASDKKALDNLTKQSSAAEAYENKAQAQLDIVDGLSDKVKRTSIPLLNRAILAGETSIMGDPDATLLLNSIQTASAEYAKIMMGGTASASALTDSAQKEAQKLLSASMNPTTLRKATQLMRTEMGLTMQGYDAAKQHISTSLGGGVAAPEQTGTAPPSVTAALQSQPPNSPGKAYTLSDGSRWVKAADGSITKAP
jgi:hypothetical protein